MSDPCQSASGLGGDAFKANVLVADDDPVSLRFLENALRELGCEVTAVADGKAAIESAKRLTFDLLLLDRRMPGSGGAQLLLMLRRCGVATTAVATSADLDAAARDELLDAGYAATLTKPIGIEALARTISAHVHGNATMRIAETAVDSASSLLDDTAGLRAVGGDATTLSALRTLLARDLEALIASDASTDFSAFAEALHRLRAACRYCGAALLERIAASIEATIRAGLDPDATALRQFAACCAQTRGALTPK